MKTKSKSKLDWVAVIKKELARINDYVKVDVHSDWNRFNQLLESNS